MNGLRVLQSLKLVHRDNKAGNILVTADGHFKIGFV
jgi:serine/threonine protein kinase